MFLQLSPHLLLSVHGKGICFRERDSLLFYSESTEKSLIAMGQSFLCPKLRATLMEPSRASKIGIRHVISRCKALT